MRFLFSSASIIRMKILSYLSTYLFYALMIDAVIMLLAPRWWVFHLFINFVPQFALAGLVVFTLLLLQKQFKKAVVLGIALLFFSVPFVFQVYASPPPVFSNSMKDEAEGISIYHINVNRINREYDRLIESIMTESPTIVTLNEMDSEWFANTRDALDGLYPHVIDFSSDGYRGMVIFSKIPIQFFEQQNFSDMSPPVVRIAFAEPSFTLFTLHALSPISAVWASERDTLIQLLAQEIQDTPGTIVVAGDFNTTMHGSILRNFVKSTDLLDARSGIGWEPSWMRGTILAVALDHIFYRGNAFVGDFRVLDDVGSDHRPIVADMYFPT